MALYRSKFSCPNLVLINFSFGIFKMEQSRPYFSSFFKTAIEFYEMLDLKIVPSYWQEA